jgi:putative transposase
MSINRNVTGPNQLWQFDIKYGYIHGENRHFYLLAFKDVFNKEIVGYHIGLNCKAHHLRLTFQEAVRQQGIENLSRLVIRSDNGPQMMSCQFQEHVESFCEHEFIPAGCPNENAYIESFFSIVGTEFFQVRHLKPSSMLILN